MFQIGDKIVYPMHGAGIIDSIEEKEILGSKKLWRRKCRREIMMEWEATLDSFLEEWKSKKEVIGALVCGSFVTGRPSSHSDIDLHIILTEEADWRERGNTYVDGFLIEYFVNPPRQIISYFEEDYAERRKMSMVQFVTGKVLFDSTGVISQLKEEANHWLIKEYPPLSEVVKEIKKYSLWDLLDNVEDCYEQDRGDFLFTYHNSLYGLYSEYAQLLQVEIVPYHQLKSYFQDPFYLQKYVKDPFPDSLFVQKFLAAIPEQDPIQMMIKYKDMTKYVLEQVGGFKIDGWRIRSEVKP